MIVSSQPALSSGLSKQMRNEFDGDGKEMNKIEMLCVMKFDAIIIICIIAVTCHSNDVHYLNCHNFMFNDFIGL